MARGFLSVRLGSDQRIQNAVMAANPVLEVGEQEDEEETEAQYGAVVQRVVCAREHSDKERKCFPHKSVVVRCSWGFASA